MTKFDKNKNYLLLISEISKSKGLYRCEICNTEKIINFLLVKTNHDKSCGCISGRNKLNYHVLKNGKIVSDNGIILNKKMANGYESFKSKYVHRIVAEMYIPNPNNYTDVNHKNGIKTDNRVENLEWASRSMNIKHAWENKLNKGRTGRVSKKRLLTMSDIENIKNSKNTSRDIAKLYGVSKTTILNIRKNKIYTNE
jgi:hypothetical protein